LIHFYKSFALETFDVKKYESCGEVPDKSDESPENRGVDDGLSMRRHQGIIEMDTISDFEVTPAGGNHNSSHHDWISETGVSEDTPLFSDKSPSSRHSSAPADSYRKVWIVFYMLGMTTLLPWNFFIAVNDYWNYKFRDTVTNSSNQTMMQKEFTSYLAISSNIPNAVFVILNVVYGQRFRLNVRLLGSLTLMATLFIAVLIMTRMDTDTWQHTFLLTTLLIVVLLNICTAIFQGSLIGVAGKFPTNYMGGMMAGQALGGIFPALVNIGVIALQVSPSNVGFYCFLVAFMFVLLSLVLFMMIQTTAFFRHYAGTGDTAYRVTDPPHLSWSQLRQILSRCWRYCLSVFILFLTTLTVFPSVTVLVKSQFYNTDQEQIWAHTYFTPVTCFLAFNCGDYLGRILASIVQLPGRDRFGQNVTLGLSCLRIVFIPLFMLCNAAPSIRNLPVYFSQDLDYYLLMTLFSVSNGYLGNLCMMQGPKTSDSVEEQEMIASMMVAVLVLGIGGGSALSYPVVNML